MSHISGGFKSIISMVVCLLIQMFVYFNAVLKLFLQNETHFREKKKQNAIIIILIIIIRKN